MVGIAALTQPDEIDMNRLDEEIGVMENSGPKRRRFSLKIAIGALALAAAGLTYSYRVGSEVDKAHVELQSQAAKIQSLSIDLAKLSSVVEHAVDHQLPPGICVCVSKAPGSQVTRLCPAKNDTCDDESRGICAAQHPEYQC